MYEWLPVSVPRAGGIAACSVRIAPDHAAAHLVSQGGRAKHIRNAHVGLLHLEHTNLWLGPTTGPRLISYVPLDDESRARLEKIQALALAEV